MATTVSQIFHDIKTFAADKWEKVVTYFKNRKVAKLEDAEKKLPDLFDESAPPPTPLSKRSSAISENVTPQVTPPEPSANGPNAEQRQCLSDYSPDGVIFRQVLKQGWNQ